MEISLPLVGPLQKGVVPRLNSQRCVNLYPQIEEPGAKDPASLRMSPGMKRWAVGGSAPCRGDGIVLNGSMFWVFGDDFVEIDSTGARTVRGSLSTTVGRVSMAATHTEIAFVDGSDNVYVWNVTSSAFTTIDLSDGTHGIDEPTEGINPTHITMMNFYFIINRTGGPRIRRGRFYISTPNFTTKLSAIYWTGDSTTAEADPTDAILALDSTENELLLFGERSTQSYYVTESTDFPFEPARGRSLTVGIGAPFSLAQNEDTEFFISTSKKGKTSILSVPGGPIGNADIAAAMRKMTRIDDAFGFCYEQDEHKFYQLTFPSGGATWVYDVTTKMWHEKESYGLTRHLAAGVCFFENTLFVGREDTGLIYEWDLDTHTDDGQPIQWERRAPVVHASGRTIFIEEVSIEFDSGQGHSSDEEPTCILDFSVDGGQTFINEQIAYIGKAGNYTKQVKFTAMGCGKEIVFRLRGDQDYPWTILGARMRFSLGDYGY